MPYRASQPLQGLCMQKRCPRYAKINHLCLVHHQLVAEQKFSLVLDTQTPQTPTHSVAELLISWSAPSTSWTCNQPFSIPDRFQHTKSFLSTTPFSSKYSSCSSPGSAYSPQSFHSLSAFNSKLQPNAVSLHSPRAGRWGKEFSLKPNKNVKLRNRNRKCGIENCPSYARTGGFCTRHGGGRKCKVEGCLTTSQTAGFCRVHGGGSKCRTEGCTQFARVRGLCVFHGKQKQDAVLEQPIMQRVA